MIMGPAAAVVGAIAGAIIAGILGGITGGMAGARLGSIIDDNLLDNYRCLDCGHHFSAGDGPPNPFDEEPPSES
jgi:hypothetical protein